MNFTLAAKIITLVLAGVTSIYSLVYFMVETKETNLEHRLVHLEKEIDKGERFTKEDGRSLIGYVDEHGSEIGELRVALASLASLVTACSSKSESLVYRVRRLENSYYGKDFNNHETLLYSLDSSYLFLVYSVDRSGSISPTYPDFINVDKDYILLNQREK